MTLIEKLKGKEIPLYLKEIAKEEEIPLNLLVDLILKGRVVVPFNPIHSPKKACAIGEKMRIKINVNIGTSPDREDLDLELKKLEITHKFGADTVMDLSIGENPKEIRRLLLSKSQLPFGTVPVYEAALYGAKAKGNITELEVNDFLDILKKQAEDGVDFFTIHAGITLKCIEILKKSKRILNVVSRGGALLLEWMVCKREENPYYRYFDEVLGICKEHNITISLGDALRPGAIADAGDTAQYCETLTASELVKRARKENIQVMVEGPGHVPLDRIEHQVKAIKELTDYAPLYVLGPLVTDIAAGYDHINSAIGASIAGLAGADFICYVTPAEHLSLPDLQDIKDGIIASKIAAQAVDVAHKNRKAWEKEISLSLARKKRNWEKQLQLVLDTNKAKEQRNKIPAHIDDTCSMCSKYCSIKIVEEYLKQK
jgi:phosphomethylpyrimidine synthase